MSEPRWDGEFGVYRLREWTEIPGKNGAPSKRVRIIVTNKDAKKCRKLLKKKYDALCNYEEPPPPAPKREAFASFAADWLKTYPAKVGNRANTIKEKEYHLRIHVLPFFARLADERGGEPYTLDEVTEEVLDRFGAELAKTPRVSRAKKPEIGAPSEPATLSPKSVNNIVQTVCKMLGTAKRWKRIDVLPEFERIKVPKAKFDFFTFEEADRLLAKIADENDRALIMTKMRLGLRASELLGLTWEKISFTNGEVLIDQQIARGSHALVPVKAGDRPLPIPPRLLEILRGLKHLRAKWVFCDGDGRPFSLGHLRKTIAKWCRRAGLREMHPHGLRHTFASHLVMRGVPLVQVKEWLGHTSITMTMRYSHLAPKVNASMINLIEAAPPPATTTDATAQAAAR